MIYHSNPLYINDQNRNLTHEREHHARNIFIFLSHGLPTRSRWIRSSSNRKSTFPSRTLLPPKSRTRLKSAEVFGKSPRLLRKSPLLFVLTSHFFSEQKRRRKRTGLTLTKKRESLIKMSDSRRKKIGDERRNHPNHFRHRRLFNIAFRLSSRKSRGRAAPRGCA